MKRLGSIAQNLSVALPEEDLLSFVHFLVLILVLLTTSDNSASQEHWAIAQCK